MSDQTKDIVPTIGDTAPDFQHLPESPSSTSNSSTTSVTINGQTKTFDGPTSYDSTYTDDSGSHVSISVHNTSTGTAPDDHKEETTQ